MIKVLAYVVYVLTANLTPKADVAIVESILACREWHHNEAKTLNQKYGKDYIVVVYDCVDLGIDG